MKLFSKAFASTGKITITPAAVGPLSDVVIAGGVTQLTNTTVYAQVNKFTLSAGAVLIIGSNNLSISAAEIVVDDGASILSWSGNAHLPLNGADGASPGAAGSPGISAANAGSVSIVAQTITFTGPTQQLLIDLSGLAGGNGGKGADGSPGLNGANGANANYRYIDIGGDEQMVCAGGPTNGQSGGNGSNGGDGGDPGNGGNGGNITIHIGVGPTPASVIARSNGSPGGTGGAAGAGGPAGKGGAPGSQDAVYVCNPNVQAGPNGSAGQAGIDKSQKSGMPGQSGVAMI